MDGLTLDCAAANYQACDWIHRTVVRCLRVVVVLCLFRHVEAGSLVQPFGVSSPAFEISSNVPMGSDPPPLPPARRAQAEPFIARSYSDPSLIVATFQEGRFEDGGAVTCGYAVSNDAGLTWSRALIPHLVASIDGGSFIRASDPVAAIDLKNNVYLSVLAIRGLTPTLQAAVVLSRSPDGGKTFGEPLTVFSESRTGFYPDKNWLTINTFAATPDVNRVVATFTYFTPTNNVIYSTLSDDQGESWSTPQAISPANCQGSQPVFLPDGSLVVVYWNIGNGWIELARSPDGGQTFGARSRVAPVTTTSDPVARDSVLLPAATTDRENGVIYVTYKALVGWPRVMFTKSIDQGATWTPPIPISDNPSGHSVFAPAIAVSPDGQHVTVAFYDNRNDTGQGTMVDFYLAQSFDGGATWGANLRLTEVSSDLLLAPLTPQGRMVGDYFGIVPALRFDIPAVAVWIDTRSGSPDPYGVRINRIQGSTYATWQRLRFSPDDVNNPAVSGPEADPDHRGLPNLLQYALGGGALTPVTNSLAANAPASSLASGPVLTYAASPVLADLAVTWLSSSNLADWVPATPVSQRFLSGTQGGIQPTEVTFAPPAVPVSFYRLGVTNRAPSIFW